MGGGDRQAGHPDLVRVRAHHLPQSGGEAARKAENERIYAPRRERAEKAKTEPATEAQVKYLITLAEKVGKERLDAEFAKVIKGRDIAPRAPRQRCATAAERLTKARARNALSLRARSGRVRGRPGPRLARFRVGMSGMKIGLFPRWPGEGQPDQGPAAVVCQQVDLAGQSAPGASQGLSAAKTGFGPAARRPGRN
ncbi:hypothetical protein ACFV30_27380 [Streptomyces sp. NPDC059752]|uniref:hypothetical protein n=1 Tax=unclassified Streptomyces TaxID=2593676 RepID=UPI0036550574